MEEAATTDRPGPAPFRTHLLSAPRVTHVVTHIRVLRRYKNRVLAEVRDSGRIEHVSHLNRIRFNQGRYTFLLFNSGHVNVYGSLNLEGHLDGIAPAFCSLFENVVDDVVNKLLVTNKPTVVNISAAGKFRDSRCLEEDVYIDLARAQQKYWDTYDGDEEAFFTLSLVQESSIFLCCKPTLEGGGQFQLFSNGSYTVLGVKSLALLYLGYRELCAFLENMLS